MYLDGSPRLTVQEMQRVLHNYIEKCQQFYTHELVNEKCWPKFNA